MAFQNRVAEHLNRKQLTVVKETINESGQKVFLVEVERADGHVDQAGTPLTADKLNEEIKTLIDENVKSIGVTATTQCECDYSDKVATTKFVWDVLTALGLTKIYHNHTDYTGGSGSGGGNSET